MGRPAELMHRAQVGGDTRRVEGLVWIVLLTLPILIWTAASRGVRWWASVLPVLAMAVVALIALARYDDQTQPGEEPPILGGLEELLLLAIAAWMATAVAVGWAIRLWRSGRRAWGGTLA